MGGLWVEFHLLEYKQAPTLPYDGITKLIVSLCVFGVHWPIMAVSDAPDGMDISDDEPDTTN